MASNGRRWTLIAATGCAGLVLATLTVTTAQAKPAGATTITYVEWNAVDAGSANDVWAVGNVGFRRLTASAAASHWDGSTWTESRIGVKGDELHDVSVLPDGQAWAVGWTRTTRDGVQPLIEHWDGTQWAPQQSAGNGELSSVSAVSPTDVWAVGFVSDRNSTDHPFVEHWDGTIWTRVETPTDGADDDFLTGVTMQAADDGWAVGFQYTRRALLLHWDGTSWTSVKAPQATAQVYPNDVDAATPGDAWLVGMTSRGDIPALTQHWNGTRWLRVKGPDNGFDPILNSVSSLAASDTWAVGYAQHEIHHSVTYKTLTAHWDGSQWVVIPSPNPTKKLGDALNGVAAVSTDDVWAVGATNAFVYTKGSLIMHWDGQEWSVVS